SEYKAGRTPNPDILCNREIKFNVFAEYAHLLGADWVATGHYARLASMEGKRVLMKGLDLSKDQSYFLQAVAAARFERCLFPLGELRKSQVRELARQAGIPTFAKKDSTGICFIGERRFRDFLAQYIPAQPGPIVTTGGEILGEHTGLMFHTIGQRQGLGIGGVAEAAEAPWYVVDKDLENNGLIVAQGNDHPALYATVAHLGSVHWIDGEGPCLPSTVSVKTRYRQPDQTARLTGAPDGFRLEFSRPQRALTPGQWACFYDDDICLGGGVIESRERS
ncbi:MAG: tRNA 2-thiouridine(34) synthase MnmA, partial [Pseudomonadales bacterium]